MSITISNCNEICNAPTNSSSAKMLYSFPKQSRFLKRKTILYIYFNLDVISSINLKTLCLREGLALAMELNMTSLGNCLIVLLQILTMFPIVFILAQRRVSLLAKVGKKWWSLVPWKVPYTIKTLVPAIMRCQTNAQKFLILCQERYK